MNERRVCNKCDRCKEDKEKLYLLGYVLKMENQPMICRECHILLREKITEFVEKFVSELS